MDPSRSRMDAAASSGAMNAEIPTRPCPDPMCKDGVYHERQRCSTCDGEGMVALPHLTLEEVKQLPDWTRVVVELYDLDESEVYQVSKFEECFCDMDAPGPLCFIDEANRVWVDPEYQP